MASTVWAVFLDLECEVEYRHGSPTRFRSPSLPVVGQWHLRDLFPALTSIMKRFGLEMILPSFRGSGKLKINSGRDDCFLVSARTDTEFPEV